MIEIFRTIIKYRRLSSIPKREVTKHVLYVNLQPFNDLGLDNALSLCYAKADMLWQNTNLGDVYVWLRNVFKARFDWIKYKMQGIFMGSRGLVPLQGGSEGGAEPPPSFSSSSL
ncbi:MAG: hypothetical protein HQL02_14030 [Nitrospirae bacterium]|nr:hypothetical protein [Nitrospirota bacterium]